PRGRHPGGDRTPARRLPLEDQARGRALSRHGEARAAARRARGGRGLARDPGRARPGRLQGRRSPALISRKAAHQIRLMARAGEVVAGTLALMQERVEPGISMAELDRIADDYIRSQDAVPTSKGYKGFPAATCISPNDMIVHGIPGDYRAKEGDIVSFDVGVTKDGLIADSAGTYGVGEISEAAQRLLDVCQSALEAGAERPPGRAPR